MTNALAAPARTVHRGDDVLKDKAIGGVAAGGLAWLLVVSAHAQTDEIQVYDATINAPGQFCWERRPAPYCIAKW